MRIAIDGFSLGLKQGTGLATYTRELSHILTKQGHEVFPIYGLNEIVTSDEKIACASFIQTLINKGDIKRTDYSKWISSALKYAPHAFLPTQGLNLNYIPLDGHIEISALSHRLPSFAGLYNCPSLYRAAQFYGAAFKRALKIYLPKDTVDVLHLTSPIPVTMPKVKKVVTMHDLVPLLLPHSTLVNLRQYQRLIETATKDADIIFSISEKTKQDLVHWLGVPEKKIHVTYQSVDIPDNYKNLTEEEVNYFLKNTFNIKSGEYFLVMGTIEPKKNIARVIDAFRLAKTDLPLMIAGKDGWLFDDVHARLKGNGNKKSSQDKKIRRINDYLPFEHLVYLMRGAKALLFPSLYEGFGLPVLEAMQLGCPVITSNTTSLNEIAGEAALKVNPNSVAEIKAAIELMDKDNALRQQLIKKGYQQAELFSPAVYAKRLAEGYAKIGLV